MTVFDLSFWDNYKNCIEATSGGNNTVIFDDLEQPSVMVRIPKFAVEDITAGAGTGVHPAFMKSGAQIPEFWVGMYQAKNVNGRALSIPGVDPTAEINFDNALLSCGAKGAGWHLMTNAEWAAVFMLSHALVGADAVHGNTYYGRDYASKFELGRRQDGTIPGTASGTARTLTGSGPLKWRHDLSPYGVADLVGNVWEWNSGLRLVDGEIQIIPDAALDRTGAAHNASTGTWQAILEDGSLTAPGTAGTLKYDASGVNGEGAPVLSTTVTSQSDGTTSASTQYKDMTASASVPNLVKQLGLYPHETNMARGRFYMRNAGERLPYRGGGWGSSGSAGLAAVNLNYARSVVDTSIGLRPAFVS